MMSFKAYHALGGRMKKLLKKLCIVQLYQLHVHILESVLDKRFDDSTACKQNSRMHRNCEI